VRRREYWDGTACRRRGDGRRVAAGKQALQARRRRRPPGARRRRPRRPLDHDANVTLWEQRGIAAAYIDDERAAGAAFDMMLALDPATS